MNEFLGAKPGRNGSFDLPVRRGSVIVSLGPLTVSLGPDNPGSIIDAWVFSPLLDLIVILFQLSALQESIILFEAVVMVLCHTYVPKSIQHVLNFYSKNSLRSARGA
jgi:hypothetical protein